MTSPRILHLISGPRNLSTALMYAFASRTDTQVVDEPFYAHYLRVSGADHPGREEILAAQPSDPALVQASLLQPDPRPYRFVKNMAHHLVDMDLDFLDNLTHLFLIRDPRQLIASFQRVIPQPTAADLGLAHAWWLFERIRNGSGRSPAVLDSGDLLQDPPVMLQRVCAALDIPFQNEMLHWQPGGIPEDGVWAPYWYAQVHQSTGFSPGISTPATVPPHCQEVYEEVLPYYRLLSEHKIQP